jgi:hypothetical protein
MVDSRQADKIIEFLNQVSALDPYAVAVALTVRVPCNQPLREHPTVQVGKSPDGRIEVSALGILNGLCGVFDDDVMKNRGAIGAVVEKGRVVRFERTDAALTGPGLKRIGATV